MTANVADEVPWSEEITAYDEAHLMVFIRLLDARADGADFDEMARVVLDIDPQREPQRARAAVASHLRRAEWMADKGYRNLLHARR